MGMSINTNVMSLNAQRNASRTQNELATTMNRLSSGMRINSAKDDAAGLAISDRFTSQIRGVNQAARNANDGISLAQTAEGALSSIGNNLQRVRELAVQSANATNSASDRATMQAEASQLISEIQRVGSQTEFNGLKLLDGSFAAQDFQVGANAGQTITVKGITDGRATGLGSHTMSLQGTVTNTTLAAAPTVTGNGVTAETDLVLQTANGGTTGSISYAQDASAKDIAAAINAAGNNIGITATASNSATLGGMSAAGRVEFDLNGKTIVANVADANDLTDLMAQINGASSGPTGTGITATFADPSDKRTLTLTSKDGSDIKLENFTHSDVAGTVSFGNTSQVTIDNTNQASIAVGKVELSSTKGQITATNADADAFAAAGTNTSAFRSVANVDISTVAGATQALETLDAALSQVSSARADLGAIQNRFSSTIENLQVSAENQSAARSRIQDADFAVESAALSRAQVLQQAGTAMIAQANQAPQQVMSLLR